MTQMIELIDMDIQTIIRNIFHMFKKLEKRLSLLRGDMDDMKKIHIKLFRHEKYNGWFFEYPRPTHMLDHSLEELRGLITTVGV